MYGRTYQRRNKKPVRADSAHANEGVPVHAERDGVPKRLASFVVIIIIIGGNVGKINFKEDTMMFRLVQTLLESNSHIFSITVLYCEKISCLI
jgi:hypothetical protein